LHFKSKSPKLKLLHAGIQNLNINDCNEEHNLFPADDGHGLIQKQAKGVQGILSPYHVYIDTCASYSITPYPELLSNLKKQVGGLIGHSNVGSCKMDSLGALEQVWLNKGGVVMIIPLKQLEKLCPVVYDSTHNGGVFICCTKESNIVLKNKARACPTLTSGTSRSKQFCPLRQKQLCPLCRWCVCVFLASSSAQGVVL